MVVAVIEQLECRHGADMSRPATRRGGGVVHCPYCHGDRTAVRPAAAAPRRGSAAIAHHAPGKGVAAGRPGARAADRAAPAARQAAYGDVFSAESEARVCDLVLGDRRHGQHVTGGRP
jgi:hypothetical protein